MTIGTDGRILPLAIHNPPPNYPLLAVRNGWHGTVLLRLWIDERGRVTRVEVHRGSGHTVLDGAAVAAARRWRYAPALADGEPVASVETQSVVFLPTR